MLIPGVPGATATATLLAGSGNRALRENCAERIEVRQGDVVTEFLYTECEDHSEPLNKIKAFFPGHIVEAQRRDDPRSSNRGDGNRESLRGHAGAGERA